MTSEGNFVADTEDGNTFLLKTRFCASKKENYDKIRLSQMNFGQMHGAGVLRTAVPLSRTRLYEIWITTTNEYLSMFYN